LPENGDKYGIFVSVAINWAAFLKRFARKYFWFTTSLGMFQNIPAFFPF
jgi:hypothetical protein